MSNIWQQLYTFWKEMRTLADASKESFVVPDLVKVTKFRQTGSLLMTSFCVYPLRLFLLRFSMGFV
jgi:hypothetical protein